MNPVRPPIVDQEKLREEICAYLDGELSSDDGREVEERLAAEPQFRDELHGLERAWRLLEELPRTDADERFAATTVEMVAIRAGDDLRRQQDQWPKLFVRGWIVSAGGMLLALLLGFGVIAGGAALLSRAGAIQTPDDRLLANLSVLTHLDVYQQVDSSDLVRRLADAKLFDDKSGGQADAEAAANVEPGATPAARRQYIEQLTPYEKKDLAEQRERFLALPPEAQARLRALDDELTTDPRAAELLRVLTRYGDWLMTLPLELRADLRRLSPQDRVTRIAELQQRNYSRKLRLQLAEASSDDVANEGLWSFFHTLPRGERDRINRLPREEGLQLLRGLYARAHRAQRNKPFDGHRQPGEPGDPRRFEPGRGPRPGDFREPPGWDRRGPGGQGRPDGGPREGGPRRPGHGPPGGNIPDPDP